MASRPPAARFCTLTTGWFGYVHGPSPVPPNYLACINPAGGALLTVQACKAKGNGARVGSEPALILGDKSSLGPTALREVRCVLRGSLWSALAV